MNQYEDRYADKQQHGPQVNNPTTSEMNIRDEDEFLFKPGDNGHKNKHL